MKKKLLSFLQFCIGWPLTIVAFIFIGKIVFSNNNELIPLLRTINIYELILSILSFLGYFFLRVAFWRKILIENGHHLSYKETAYEWALAEIKRYIPGNIWSLISRADKFSQKGIEKKSVLTFVFIEAEYIVLGSLIVSLLSIDFITSIFLPKFPYKLLLIVVLTFIVFVLIASILYFNTVAKKGNSKIPTYMLKLFPSVSLQKTISYLTIETIAMLCFGIGTYFCITSVVPLYLPNIFVFSGYFVFALLVGYVSFITPMGLGVREAVITAGLSKYISLANAGFSAIFGRLVFIISELLFLFGMYVWKKTQQKISFIEKYIYCNWQKITLGVLITCYILYFTCASFLRYDNFYTGRFDLGNMDQTVWNTLHGRVFQITDPNGTDTISRLAFHADVILVLLAPFYVLWQNPKMLLLIQTLVLALGGLFVYLIGEKVLRKKTLSLVFAFAYLMYPGVNHANLYDFHAVTIATTCLLAAFFFIETKRYTFFIIALLLAGITKEEVWLVTALLGLYTIIIKKKKLLGSFIFIYSIGLFYYIVFHLIPGAKGGEHFALSYYSDFGSTPTSIIKNIFFAPQKTIGTILQPNRLIYFFKLFIPLGFLPLAGIPFLFFALPDLTINILSNNSQLYEIYFHYTSVVVPFLFIAGIYGIKNIQKLYPRIRTQYIIIYIIITSLISSYIYGPLPGAVSANLDMFIKPQSSATIIEGFLQDIPKRLSVAATNNLGSHLSHRQNIFTIPVGIDKADIIVFLLNDQYAQPSLKAQKQLANDMKKDKNYIEIFKQGDFVVFEKRNLFLQEEPDTKHSRLFPVSVPALQHRDFIGGSVNFDKQIKDTKLYTEYLFSYPSDGLQLHGLLGVPKRKIPSTGFPAIIVNHGYIVPKNYSTENSYSNIVDYFASRGFIVVKPDYRGYGSSEVDNTALAPLSYNIDVLNLLASINTVPHIDKNNIFLWGHALGGGVSLNVLEVTGENVQFKNAIKATVVWAPVTDPYIWYQQTQSIFPPRQSPYNAVIKILGTPAKNPLLWESISQLPYLDDINTPLQIDQGTADTVTPYTSSIELYNDLASLNKSARLLLYTNDDHSLSGTTLKVLHNDLQFFRKHLQ